MVTRYGNFKIKQLEHFSIIQTKKDEQLVKSHININNNLTCAVCGREAINFEVIIKTTAVISGDKEIEEIGDSNIMLIRPIRCSFCNSSNFIETFTVNEDLYEQQTS